MIRITTLIILLGLCLGGCSEKKPRNLTANPLVKKGELFLDPETLEPHSGKVYKLNDGGAILWEVFLLNGKHHGLRTDYRSDGTKSSETHYKEGKKHGLQTDYFSDGTKSSETNYKEGKKHGLQTKYCISSGGKESECKYSNGVEGKCKTF